MKNALLILLGLILAIPAIILGPFAKLLPLDVDKPWTDGVFINSLRAYKKYDTMSWVRRFIGICKNPPIVLQYLDLLFHRERVVKLGLCYANVSSLIGSHAVQTDHDHHRNRVAELAMSESHTLYSKYGPMVVVGNKVHDGNHRLAAMREAGVRECLVIQYVSLEQIENMYNDVGKLKRTAESRYR